MGASYVHVGDCWQQDGARKALLSELSFPNDFFFLCLPYLLAYCSIEEEEVEEEGVVVVVKNAREACVPFLSPFLFLLLHPQPSLTEKDF